MRTVRTDLGRKRQRTAPMLAATGRQSAGSIQTIEGYVMNHFDQMKAAMAEAEQIQRAADLNAATMARMLRGRLRHVPPAVLADLKRELREFNAHTGEWKS